jgi:hypothetical protein
VDSELTPEELATLVRLARRVLWSDRKTRRIVQSYKIDIVPSRYYSEIPSVEEIEDSFEFRDPNGPYNSPRVFDPQAMRQFLSLLSRYSDEFSPAID